MKNLYLIQPNDRQMFLGKEVYWLPYSVGTLWAYASQFDEINNNYQLQEIMFRRENIKSVAKRILPGAVVAVSCYIWNWEYNKRLAETIKQVNPTAYIVFGGPQVTNRPLETDFFRQHPYVDSIILGEGEESFTQLLRDYSAGKTTRIHQSKRIDASLLPSPYLSGVFDQIIAENPDYIWNGIYESNRGCPFACTFCDWGGLTYSKVKKMSDDRIYGDIEWFGKNKIEYLAIADANFGIFKERDLSIARAIGSIKERYGYPLNVGISHNKNQTKDIIEMVKTLAESGLNRALTVSFQSLDDGVLKAIKRDNMEVNKAEEIFKLVEDNNLTHYSELICPLPMETYDSWRAGLIKLIGMGQHQCIDIFFTAVLENSELNHPDYKKKYGIQVIETEYIFFYNSSGWFYDPNSSEVNEKTKLVVATNTMDTTDHARSWMYSWLIVNFHTYGWAQMYARFLKNAHGVDYGDFYDGLLSAIVDNRMGTMSTQYYRTLNAITLMLTDMEAFGKSGSDPDLLRSSQRHLHNDRVEVEQLISEYVSSTYNIANFDNLKQYQTSFMSNFNKSYPYTDILDLGIKETITNAVPYVENLVECTVESVGEFSNQDEFLSRVVAQRRNGFGKNKITPILLNTSL